MTCIFRPRRFGTLIASIACALVLAGSASALTINGTITGTPAGAGFTGVGTVTSSFSLFFDESAVIGSGAEVFSPSLSSLSLSPNPVGSTTYNLTNTVAELLYLDGVLNRVIVAGDPGGTVTTANTDDFFVQWISGAFTTLLYVTSSDSGIGADFMPTGSLNVIPEPSTALLLGFGLTTLAARRRR